MRQHKRMNRTERKPDRDFTTAWRRAAFLLCLIPFAILGISYFAGDKLLQTVAMVCAVAVATTFPPTLKKLEELLLVIRALRSEAKKQRKPKAHQSNTRFWEKAGLLFGHKTRKRIYDPAIGEIREDYLIARGLCRSTADYRWVKTCFAIRGARAFLRCFWVSLLGPLTRIIPAWLRQWWNLFG